MGSLTGTSLLPLSGLTRGEIPPAPRCLGADPEFCPELTHSVPRVSSCLLLPLAHPGPWSCLCASQHAVCTFSGAFQNTLLCFYERHKRVWPVYENQLGPPLACGLWAVNPVKMGYERPLHEGVQ